MAETPSLNLPHHSDSALAYPGQNVRTLDTLHPIKRGHFHSICRLVHLSALQSAAQRGLNPLSLPHPMKTTLQSKLHPNPHVYAIAKPQLGFTQMELLLVIFLAGILPTSITAAIALNANPSLPKLSHSFTQSSPGALIP
jgi:hypothetical protein